MQKSNNKIIGFTIHTAPIDHSDVDLFKVGLKQKLILHDSFYIYLWGIGDLGRCILGNKITLSFPLHFSLDDRNVIITLLKNKIIVENDWLGSIPVFYNARTGVVSTLINKIIEPQDSTIDPEGLSNYLDFGYSVFEQTPLANVKFMRHQSELLVTPRKIFARHRPDTFINDLSEKTTPADAISTIARYVKAGSQKVLGPIIIPTSGGFDSRLLNVLVENKKRIRSFTYGVSSRQHDSYEVVKARVLAKILGTSWRQIKLKHAASYFGEWFALYGGAVHLHGMYHIEFFRKIRSYLRNASPNLLSGIIGDAWSGLVEIPPVNNPQDVNALGYAHGITFDSRFARLAHPHTAKKQFLKREKKNLQIPAFRVIASMRIKLILLSYLMSLPDYFGFASWTPFLNQDIVLKVLTLPASAKNDRAWQRKFFSRHGVDLENKPLVFTMENVSDADLLRSNPIPPLRPKYLSQYIRYGALWQVNLAYKRLIKAGVRDYHRVNKWLKSGLTGPFLVSLGVKPKYYLKPYNQFIILKSLELMMERLKR